MNLMNLLSFPNKSASVAISADEKKRILANYQRMRSQSIPISNEILSRLSRDMMYEGGQRLGMLRRDALVLDSMGEASILMDYCIQHVMRDGRNAIEQYLIDSPPDADSEEMTFLRSMQLAAYAIFDIESAERGLGVMVRDLVTNEKELVVDLGLSMTARPGDVFGTTLWKFDEFSMTSGVPLPLSPLPKETVQGFVNEFKRSLAQEGRFDPASVISVFLRKGLMKNVVYLDPIDTLQKSAPAPHFSVSDPEEPISYAHPFRNREERTGRNEPCPCGSGKKFKRCCLPKS